MNVCRQTNGRLGETGIYTFRLRADRGGRASFVRDAPGELPRTPLAVVSELAPTYAPDRTRVIPGVTETRRLWRPPDRSQDPEGSLVRTTVMDPNDPTIDGVIGVIDFHQADARAAVLPSQNDGIGSARRKGRDNTRLVCVLRGKT